MSLTETTAKPVVKRATANTNAIGAPTLLVNVTSEYNLVYNDQGSGADMDVSIYRPVPPNGFYIIGDYAQGNYDAPSGISEVVTAVNDDPSNPMLLPPVGYQPVWTDQGSGGDMDGSVWYPVPPAGYVSLGFIGQSGYNEPSIPYYRCVRIDLVSQGAVGNLIWNDQGSGADMDVSIYAEHNASNCFVAQGNYNPYSGVVYDLKTEE